MPSTAATAKKSSAATNPGPALLITGPVAANPGPTVTPAPRPISGDAAQIREEHDYCKRPREVPQTAQPPPVVAAQQAAIVVAAL